MNQEDGGGYRLMFSLIGAFRRIIDELHEALAQQGFADVRPLHGFVLQAIGVESVSISELGKRLGVSKQAAAKTVQAMEALDLLLRTPDPTDARASLISRSPRGEAMLLASAQFFDIKQDQWRDEIGAEAFAGLVQSLDIIGGHGRPGDFVGWLQ